MAALRRLNRKQRRAGAELLTGSRAYIRAAAESLGFSDEQLAEAQSGAGESADMLMARVFELLELQHGHSTPDCQQARAEMEARRGAGFLKRVQRMGKPAAVALRALMITLALFVLSLFPRSAEAAVAKLATLRNAHKIQRRNRQSRRASSRRLKFVTVVRHSYHRRRGWIQSSRSYGRSPLRSSSRPRFVTGCGSELGSCVNKGLTTSRSSWSGVAESSGSGASRRGSLTSRFDGATARSKARLTSSRAGFEK